MNKEEALEFFNKVKGCKIRWTGWDKKDYFIPERLKDTFIYGTFYSSMWKESRDDFWSIAGGFKKTDRISSNWEYIIDINKELENV